MESNNTSDRLQTLQDILIDEMLRRIKTGEATAADLGAARQLLKDNGIQAVANDGNPMESLMNTLPFDDGVEQIRIAHGEEL